MTKEQIIDEVYEYYCISYKDGHEFYEDAEVKRSFTKEEFINKCKTDTEFSERWGLKIEERELSLEERNEIRDMQYFKNNLHQALKGSDTKSYYRQSYVLSLSYQIK